MAHREDQPWSEWPSVLAGYQQGCPVPDVGKIISVMACIRASLLHAYGYHNGEATWLGTKSN